MSTGHGHKIDEADAVSVGIAALTATELNTATIDAANTVLRAPVEHRDDLVRPAPNPSIGSMYCSPSSHPLVPHAA